MAKVVFDGPNKLIIVNNGITALTVKTDLYSDWKEWALLSDNAKYLPAFRVIGGDEISTGVSVDGTFFLMNGWKIRPYEGNHVLTITGNLYVDGGGSVVVQTVGSYNVLVNLLTSNIVNLVTIASGSGVTNQDKIDIIQGVKDELKPEIDAVVVDVWSEVISGYTAVGSAGQKLNSASVGGIDYDSLANAVHVELQPEFDGVNLNIDNIPPAVIGPTGINDIANAVHTALQEDFDLINGTLHNLVFVLSQGDIDAITLAIYNNLSPDLNIIKGLVQHNFRFANQTYTATGKLLTGVIKIYPTTLDVENNTNEINAYTVNADYDSNGNLIDYKVTEQ